MLNVRQMLNAAASEKNDFAEGDGVRVQSVGKSTR